MPSYADPLRAGRHPFQRYMLALAVVGGAPLLVGRVTAGSIEETLPLPVVIVWGTLLFIGASVALLGVFWPLSEPVTADNFATALFLERLGLGLVWPTALLYAAVIVLVSGLTGWLAAAIVAGFGWAARRRERDVAKTMRRAIKAQRA